MNMYITLDEATELLPIKPNRSTIWRWCARGIYVRGVDEVVRMKFVRIGRKLFTTADWVEEFIHRLTAATMATHEAWKRMLPDFLTQRFARR